MRTLAMLLVVVVGCGPPAAKHVAPPKDPDREAKKAEPVKDVVSSPDGDGAGDPDDGPDPDAAKQPVDATGTSRGMRKHSASPTTVGQPVSQGNLDKAIIRRYIKRVLGKISECYEKELTTQPSLEGKVTIQFEIAPDGKVSKSAGSGMAKVDACVAAVIQTIEFPKPLGGGSVAVTYPFLFRPAGG